CRGDEFGALFRAPIEGDKETSDDEGDSEWERPERKTLGLTKRRLNFTCDTNSSVGIVALANELMKLELFGFVRNILSPWLDIVGSTKKTLTRREWAKFLL